MVSTLKLICSRVMSCAARRISLAIGTASLRLSPRIVLIVGSRELLTGRNPMPCRVFLAEAVLRQNIGGPTVMVEQLRYLRSRMQLRNVSVRIVPNSIGYHPGLYGPFILFDYADLPPIETLRNCMRERR